MAYCLLLFYLEASLIKHGDSDSEVIICLVLFNTGSHTVIKIYDGFGIYVTVINRLCNSKYSVIVVYIQCTIYSTISYDKHLIFLFRSSWYII